MIKRGITFGVIGIPRDLIQCGPELGLHGNKTSERSSAPIRRRRRQHLLIKIVTKTLTDDYESSASSSSSSLSSFFFLRPSIWPPLASIMARRRLGTLAQVLTTNSSVMTLSQASLIFWIRSCLDLAGLANAAASKHR